MEAPEISQIYQMICEYHTKYLKEKNVVLPRLYNGDSFSKDALTLVFLARNYPNTSIVTKQELTEFIREFYPDVTDVQQARHLAAQKGWFILSGTRKDMASIELLPGQYKLVSLEMPYPDFTAGRRIETEGDDYFEQLKIIYDYRCATCGSKEGEPNYNWKNTKTVLQKGHMDPNKPLEPGNIIPQCEKCNRADRNYWIYDTKGRVIAIANPIVVDRCSTKIQKEIYERLKLKFGSKK